jgi:hypothetical protein
MKPSDVTELTRVLTSLSSLYGKPMSKPLMELYWAALKRFDLSEVKRALQAHVSHPDTGQYMPKPADVVRFLQGDSRTQALQAWSRAVRASCEVGIYTSVIFDDPVIHAVIRDMGGWVPFCQIREKELPFRERNFTERYVGYLHHPPAHYPKQLTGLFAHHNALQGYKSEPPVCIGDPQKARGVYQRGQIPGSLYHALPAEKIGEAQAVITLTHLGGTREVKP